jgi:hypothetical protein
MTTKSNSKKTEPVVENPQVENTQPEAAPIATLLSSISYTNQNDYEQFLANLTPEHSVIVLISAATHCQAKGIFTLDESELIAKAIKKLSVQPNPPAAKATPKN